LPLRLVLPDLVDVSVHVLVVGAACNAAGTDSLAFTWKRSADDKPAQPVRKENSRPAAASAILGFAATALLIFAASHARADRSHRRPVVTWEGIAAPFVEHLAYLGWGLSVIAMIVAIYALHQFSSRWNAFALVAFVLACLNLFGSCLFCALLHED
jgi:cell division protein FtsW (lipid II flippase)